MTTIRNRKLPAIDLELKQTQHTPGPWSVTDVDKLLRVGAAGAGDIAHVFSNVLAGDARANARLIAAAPDLLAACKAAEGYLMPYADTSAPNSPDKKVLAQVVAAIAKAEGRAL